MRLARRFAITMSDHGFGNALRLVISSEMLIPPETVVFQQVLSQPPFTEDAPT